MRPVSSVAPEWWDYTTIDSELVEEAAKLTPEAMIALSRDGFRVVMYDKVEEFYLAEALEYIDAWRRSTPDHPCGICGPIGPTELALLVTPRDLTPGSLPGFVLGGSQVPRPPLVGIMKQGGGSCSKVVSPC